MQRWKQLLNIYGTVAALLVTSTIKKKKKFVGISAFATSAIDFWYHWWRILSSGASNARNIRHVGCCIEIRAIRTARRRGHCVPALYAWREYKMVKRTGSCTRIIVSHMPIMMRRAESRRDAGYYVRSLVHTPRVVSRQRSPRWMDGRVCFQKTRFVCNNRFSRRKKYFWMLK